MFETKHARQLSQSLEKGKTLVRSGGVPLHQSECRLPMRQRLLIREHAGRSFARTETEFDRPRGVGDWSRQTVMIGDVAEIACTLVAMRGFEHLGGSRVETL